MYLRGVRVCLCICDCTYRDSVNRPVIDAGELRGEGGSNPAIRCERGQIGS